MARKSGKMTSKSTLHQKNSTPLISRRNRNSNIF